MRSSEENRFEVNYQAPAVARSEILILAPPEQVWDIHTNIDSWHMWNPAISASSLHGPIAVGSIFRWKSGGLTITSTLKIVEPQRQIGWTGKGFGTRAVHRWELERLDHGTLLRTEESLEGWLVRLLKGMMGKMLEDSLIDWLAALKAQSEGYESEA
jgi:hypothetical protein